ncbi:MAG: phosphate acyltransferase PlsX [Bacteroidales bacterium]|nr:phosphate acyltransferase PlsX [Bacteroidales bacterium]
MRIGLDAMGGDYAPRAVVEGAVDVLPRLDEGTRIVLIGDEKQILENLSLLSVDPSGFDIVHTSQVITMADHPAKAFSQKRNSSIAVGFGMLKNGMIDGFASAGNTGAMLVGASYTVNVIPGIYRPALAALVPSVTGKSSIILDVGINPDTKPDVLLQYGLLGSMYAQHVMGIETPRVALINIGEEETKGSSAVRSAYELMKDHPDINFVGNVEGNALFGETMPDVLVCDGFVGNVIIKEAEAFYNLLRSKNISDPLFERFDFENIGGTPVIGVNANVVIGHGISRRRAIMNMVLETENVVRADLAGKIKLTLSNGKD